MGFSQADMKDKDGMKMSYMQERRCQRYYVPWTLVEYHLDSDFHQEPYIGVVVNASDLGLCLNTTGQLNIGQTMKIESPVPKFSKTAVVRWVENITISFCKAGLKFCDTPTHTMDR